ncbi:MAG: thiolase family protein [Deltaproteobacteria bacterium]|nr:thiolase family protein [Deltaproteobacteria bacterium]
MPNIVITGAARTPIGKYLGSLRDIPAVDLAAQVLNAAAERSGIDPSRVDDVILGQAYQNGENVNIARVALLTAGWPMEIPGLTIDRRCLSGIEAVSVGAMKIQCGLGKIVVAGGVESMSRTEFYVPGEWIKWGLGGQNDATWGFMPRGHGALSMWGLPFFDRIQRARVMSQPIKRFGELNSMMTWAEAAAHAENITREQADTWALASHAKAVKAIDSGKFKRETIAVPIPQLKSEPQMFAKDETPRSDATLAKLARLSPVYPDGICTAGNSATENDGAAAVVLMTKEKSHNLQIPYLGELISFGTAACDPRLTYPAVPAAVTKALSAAGLNLADMDLIEIQEAFAAQVLADVKLMGLEPEEIAEKVNVNGSGISLGHPIAATGTMRLISLLHEMHRRQAAYGLVAICGGGGQGIAAVVKR